MNEQAGNRTGVFAIRVVVISLLGFGIVVVVVFMFCLLLEDTVRSFVRASYYFS